MNISILKLPECIKCSDSLIFIIPELGLGNVTKVVPAFISGNEVIAQTAVSGINKVPESGVKVVDRMFFESTVYETVSVLNEFVEIICCDQGKE